MNNTSDFTSNFWNIYIAVILVVSFLGLAWLLISQNKVKKVNKDGDVETMGHEWDGIEEYNNPLPRWWFYMFVITVIFGVVYLVLYPGFASFKGVLNWTSHNQYDKEMVVAQEKYQPIYDQFANKTVEEIAGDPTAKTIGQNLFNTYCIQCHGSDAKGAKGFPNLTDHDWLWGGDPETISETIKEGRMGIMPAYGGLPPFPEETVKDVTNYVISLNENPKFKARANSSRVAKGKVIYDQICFTCHQADGKGIVGLAPNLTDSVWLWGARKKDIEDTIIHGHSNQMPAWKNFLVTTDKDGKEDDIKLKILTAYVWGLSNTGVEGTPAPAETVATTPEAVTNEEATNGVDKVVVGEDGMVKFYFATGSANLAEGTATALADVVKGLNDDNKIVISGFHDETGDAAQNAELAKKRAQAVAEALLALGVSADKIDLKKPEVSVGSGSNAEARRVEVSLQ